MTAKSNITAVCVTGGIACGKSLAGAMFAALGAVVLDTDRVCRALMRAGSPLGRRVARAFGPECLGRGGRLDRAALGRIVFGDAAKLRRLNRIVHPAVIRHVESWLARLAVGRRRRVAVVLAPLVYEIGWERAWDRIVCVAAPERAQAARLKLRGLSAVEARRRIDAQLPVEEKMLRSDYVLFNGGARACLRRQAEMIYGDVLNLRR